MAAMLVEPTFLYPHVRTYAFDDVCARMTRALEERGWNVPGIEVTFHDYGSGDCKYRRVERIMADDFSLWFCREQGRLDSQYYDTAAVHTVTIPRHQIEVYSDSSGPTYYCYVGADWEADRERFMTHSKVNSRLYHEDRWYLKYNGSSTRGALLVHDNDLGREHGPSLFDPESYHTEAVASMFATWLEERLALILETPVSDDPHVGGPKPEPALPMPDWTNEIYCFGDARTANRVRQGQLDPEELDPAERYGIRGNAGTRLMPLSGGGDVPEIAYEGFEWCSFGEVGPATGRRGLEIPGAPWQSDSHYVFRITPNRGNDVYVVDNAPYERRRTELFEQINADDSRPHKRLTEAELNDAECVRARTIIPIAEYDGTYEQPIVLINRELGFDEVELVSGPWPLCGSVLIIAGYSDKAKYLLDAAVRAQVEYRWKDEPAERALKQTADSLAYYLIGSQGLDRAAEAYAHQANRRATPDRRFIDKLIGAATDMFRLGLYK